MKSAAFLTLIVIIVTGGASGADQAPRPKSEWGGYQPPEGSIDEHLWTNWSARSSPGKTARMLSWAGHVQVVQATNALWDTNWYFYGTENFTAQTLVRTNAGEAWFLKRSAIITPLVILQSGHNFCGERADGRCGTNQWYLAVDATNGQHWRKVVWGISRQGSAGDYYVAAMDRPWPTNISTMPIAFYAGQGTNSFTNKLNANMDLRHYWPTFYNSQYLRTEGANFHFIHRMPNTWTRLHPTESPTNRTFAGGINIPLHVNSTSVATESLGAVMGGDSGSPTYMVISNKLVLFSGSWRTASLITDINQFLADVNTCTVSAGFTTNQYPVQFEWLTAFPAKQ